jgi:hypothetical protein
MTWTRLAEAGISLEPGRALHAAAGPLADTGTLRRAIAITVGTLVTVIGVTLPAGVCGLLALTS